MRIEEILPILKRSPYFTKQNLSLSLGLEGEDLNYWIKKLLKEKILIPVKKGLYISSYYKDIISQNPEESESYLEYLANIIRFPSYISLEYVLGKISFIPEAVWTITSVTTKSSRKYFSDLTTFTYRTIKKELFYGYTQKQYRDKIIRIASPAKAVFDYLYLKRFFSKPQMINELKEDGRFNWEVLSTLDKQEFIKICNTSSSGKMSFIASVLKKEKIL